MWHSTPYRTSLPPPDEEFVLIFPPGHDIAFIDEVLAKGNTRHWTRPSITSAVIGFPRSRLVAMVERTQPNELKYQDRCKCLLRHLHPVRDSDGRYPRPARIGVHRQERLPPAIDVVQRNTAAPGRIVRRYIVLADVGIGLLAGPEIPTVISKTQISFNGYHFAPPESRLNGQYRRRFDMLDGAAHRACRRLSTQLYCLLDSM